MLEWRNRHAPDRRFEGSERTEHDLKQLFVPDRWNTLHLQIIFFGREHCPARGHDLTTCPICGWAASKKRIAEERRRQAPRRR